MDTEKIYFDNIYDITTRNIKRGDIMKLTQYCGRCGCKLELNFGRLFKRTRCPCCKTKIKYKETKDGMLRYIYKAGNNCYFDEREVAKVGTGIR